MFIFEENENAMAREIMASLPSKDHRDALASRAHRSNKSTFTSKIILDTTRENPDLIKDLYDLFKKRFDPGISNGITATALDEKLKVFEKKIASRFIDFTLGYDIFAFMTKIVSCTLKTNFYMPEKRSFAFRYDNRILDPLVFDQFVFGIFHVSGHYACGTHLRAGDIARGGLRLLRVTGTNHSAELDNAVLLNYALGPKAQRLKHKDICESGSKGVVVPHAIYAGYGMDALHDYTEGIMDLMLGDDAIVDYYGRPEMIAFMRHTSPRANTLQFPVEKLSPRGFRVPLKGKNITLPDGTFVEDGAMFHRTFLSEPGNRERIRQANIQAFIPCGGFKDTVNQGNVEAFLSVFKELRFIVEGANVFFDDASRRYIAGSTGIKHIKDTTANKGGVFSSSIAEVLTAFLFEENYEAKLLNDTDTQWALIRDIMTLVDNNARAETDMLIRIHEADPSVPLFVLSEKTSEQIFALQGIFEEKIPELLENEACIRNIMENYIPAVIIDKLGWEFIIELLNSDPLETYRNAIITKKLSAMAFYRFGLDWDGFLKSMESNFQGGIMEISMAMN